MSNPNKKYVAMVMDRHYIGPESFIYSCNHAVIGYIDQETGIFTDTKGNEYAPILNEGLLKSEIPYAYNNICELDKIKEYYNAPTISASLSEYEYYCKQMIYYVSTTEEGIPFLVSHNIEAWREQVEKQIKRNIQEKEENEEEYEEEYEDQLTKLMADIINNKYTKEELNEIKKGLKNNQEEIESAIDTIDLQLEAMGDNEKFIEHTEKKESKNKIKNNVEEKNVIEEKKVEEENIIEEKKVEKKIDIEDLFNKVTKTLIAQDEPARRVIVELARKEMDERKKKEAILITGPTGVGKTELMRLIAKYIDRPFIKVDSTQLTVPGYVGKDIEEVLWDLYIMCDRDLEKAERAIVYFDEIDKKGSSKKSDVSGQGVLNVLLPFIEGSTYDACADLKNRTKVVKIDTSNMIVTLGGAYTDVYKNLLEKNGIGFGGNIYDKPTYREATTKDFVDKGGMTDEFMGRVTVIPLDALDVDSIIRVMLESDESQIKIQEKIFEKLNTKITFTNGCLTKVAKNAVEKKTGARGLNGIIDSITWKAFDEVYTNPGKYKEVIITEDTIDDASNYQLVKKRGRKKKNN